MLAPAEVGWDLTLYARAWLEERAKVALETAERAALDQGRGAVHEVRVAARRLREAIAFCQGLPEIPPLTDVDRAARRMARVVRRLRETDVAVKRLAQVDLGESAERASAFKARLVDELGQHRLELAKGKRTRIAKRARDLRAAIRVALPRQTVPGLHGREGGPEAKFCAFVEARVASRRAEVEHLFGAARARKTTASLARATEELHGVRVAVKHWRYASEIARPAIPRVLYRPMAAELRRLQELGGASQDFADLARVVEKEVARARKLGPEQATMLKAVRAARDRAALAFAEALAATFPGTRASSSARYLGSA
jgi:CHAD domain-containing protein